MTRQALPIIMPFAFGMVDETPIFRVSGGVVRAAVTRDAVCCFEVDAADPTWSWAWSVMMNGHIAAVGDGPTLRQAALLALPVWPREAVQEPTYVRIDPDIVSGRWYSSDAAPAPPSNH